MMMYFGKIYNFLRDIFIIFSISAREITSPLPSFYKFSDFDSVYTVFALPLHGERVSGVAAHVHVAPPLFFFIIFLLVTSLKSDEKGKQPWPIFAEEEGKGWCF